MNKLVSALAIVLLSIPASTVAQQPPPPQKDDSPFAQYLYPPEMVLQRLTLMTPAQRDGIKAEILKSQKAMLGVQLRMLDENAKLEKLLQEQTIDEARVLEQVDAILQLEREIKRSHVAMLIRIRNTLDEGQLIALRAHRRELDRAREPMPER